VRWWICSIKSQKKRKFLKNGIRKRKRAKDKDCLWSSRFLNKWVDLISWSPDYKESGKYGYLRGITIKRIMLRKQNTTNAITPAACKNHCERTSKNKLRNECSETWAISAERIKAPCNGLIVSSHPYLHLA
tara:strand:+ start:220 stop:612 length:393 start_codon:yes stop_codon:yes gene_type:complete